MNETTTSQPLRIFLVEDSDADARIMEETLREMPFPTHLDRVENGEAVLTFLRQSAPYENALQPGLILLDLHLPGKNGFEVINEIRGDSALRSIPVVVCLSSVLDVPQLDPYQFPPDCIFTKGYDPDRLLHILTRCPEVMRGV